MNDSLSVYLNLDMENRSRNEEVIRKIDKLLLTVGMKYSGIMNIYVPVDRKKRDQIVFQAEELLRATDWLKDILAYTMVGTLTNACPVEEILTDRMSNPSPEKLRTVLSENRSASPCDCGRREQAAQRRLYILASGQKV